MRTVAAIVIGLLLMSTVAEGQSPCGSPAPSHDPQPMTTWAADPVYSWRWDDVREGTCRYPETGVCWAALIRTAEACVGGLWAEVTITDAEGVAIASSASFSGAVTAGQSARLVFGTDDPAAIAATLGRIICL